MADREIAPNIMMKFCLHVQNENVTDLRFVEPENTAYTFNDTEVDLAVF